MIFKRKSESASAFLIRIKRKKHIKTLVLTQRFKAAVESFRNIHGRLPRLPEMEDIWNRMLGMR